MKNILTVIPAAGRGSRMLQLTDNCAKSMIPIAGKPLISYLLDQIIENGLSDVAIVVGYKKETIIDYVDTFYANKLTISYIEQKELLGLGHAVYELVSQVNICKYDGIFIMLGDAIFTNNAIFNFKQSYIACAEMIDYSRWCIAEKDKNNYLIRLIDKPKTKPKCNYALLGAYYFDNTKLFNSSVIEAIDSGIKIRDEFQLSTAIELYNQKNKIKLLLLDGDNDWLDFGEFESYYANSKKIIRSRYFNTVDFHDDTIIKKSTFNPHKIQNEIMWYLALPKELHKYVPKLLSYDLNDIDPMYQIEYCNGSTLQELWLYSNLSIEQWTKILHTIMCVLQQFNKASKQTTFDFYSFITSQINKRVDLNTFFNDSNFIINNKCYDLITLKEKLLAYIESKKEEWSQLNATICHGDMVFSNMLYDSSNNKIKLIDPRGKFNDNILYGTMLYDFAKLTQCIIGDYDYIVNDLFVLDDTNYKVLKNNLFDVNELINIFNVDKKTVYVITAIQFMTMIPLHKENSSHQIIMKYKAIELLNAALNE